MKKTKSIMTLVLLTIAVLLSCDEGLFVDPGTEEYTNGGGTGSGGGGVGGTGGRLNIVNIPAAYNGKWIIADAIMLSDGTTLIGAQSMGAQGITGARISGGEATLNVWAVDTSSNRLVGFNGSGTATMFLLEVLNQASLSMADMAYIPSNINFIYSPPSWLHAVGFFYSGTFASGVCALGGNDAVWVDEIDDWQ